jgi:hypothetical protein
MCSGGRFLAGFTAGTAERPDVPDAIGESLTLTVDETWVVWAHKVARPEGDWSRPATDRFRPLTGGDPYPRDAIATCLTGANHKAPKRNCSCGFHALSTAAAPLVSFGAWQLDVAVSGRILAFEWPGGAGGGVLFRAERQTVIRAAATWDPPAPPADPAGWLAARPIVNPRGAAPTHLDLPEAVPPTVGLADDAGYCMLDHGNIVPVSETVLVGAF